MFIYIPTHARQMTHTALAVVLISDSTAFISETSQIIRSQGKLTVMHVIVADHQKLSVKNYFLLTSNHGAWEQEVVAL